MKSTMKNVITLTIITVVAGFLLGFVYDITKEPIARMEEKTKQEAYLAVFPSAASFGQSNADCDSFGAVLESAGVIGVSVNEVLDALDSSSNRLGYVVTTTSHEGYGGDIQISVGIDANGCVLGVSILSISETAGLGMKAKNADFLNQFKNKTVDQFTYTKSGATQDSEIDAISGATITTKAFTNAVNAALAVYNNLGGAK